MYSYSCISKEVPSNKYGWFTHFLSCIKMFISLVLTEPPGELKASRKKNKQTKRAYNSWYNHQLKVIIDMHISLPIFNRTVYLIVNGTC